MRLLQLAPNNHPLPLLLYRCRGGKGVRIVTGPGRGGAGVVRGAGVVGVLLGSLGFPAHPYQEHTKFPPCLQPAITFIGSGHESSQGHRSPLHTAIFTLPIPIPHHSAPSYAHNRPASGGDSARIALGRRQPSCLTPTYY